LEAAGAKGLMAHLSVNKQGNSVDLQVNLDFYPRPQVILAARDFSDSCWVNISDPKNDFVSISLKPKSPGEDVSLLGYEFFNYLLSLVRYR
jgi:hypothetical protein